MSLSVDDVGRLYDRCAGELLGFFVARTLDPEAGVDLLGETFAAAFESRSSFRGRGEGEQRAWLYGIARHQLVDFFRAGGIERRALRRLGVERRTLTDAEYDRIEELAASAELREACAQILDDLPEDQRDAVRLRVVEELPYAETAQRLGISEPTARARVSRGLRALRTVVNLQEDIEHA